MILLIVMIIIMSSILTETNIVVDYGMSPISNHDEMISTESDMIHENDHSQYWLEFG